LRADLNVGRTQESRKVNEEHTNQRNFHRNSKIFKAILSNTCFHSFSLLSMLSEINFLENTH